MGRPSPPPPVGSEGFKESSGLFGRLVPDYTAFILPIALFAGDLWRQYQKKGIITTFQTGGRYILLGFHPEGLVPWLPLGAQIAFYLADLSLRGLFVQEIAVQLLAPLCEGWDWWNPLHRHSYLRFLKRSDIRWYRMEVAYDFPKSVSPFAVGDPAFVHIEKKTTIYAPPRNRKYRTVDGKHGPRRESKERDDSLLAIYDRGLKIREPSFLRFEIRLDKDRLKAFDVEELFLPFALWVEINRERISKVVARSVPRGTILVDWPLLCQTNPELADLLQLAGW